MTASGLEFPDWDRDGLDWPNRDASGFVEDGGLRWHLQRHPRPGAPTVLLVHGLGSATHTWRGLAPVLARRFTVIAPDLPGHAFSGPLPPERRPLEGSAAALADLLAAVSAAPDIVVGHAAGAALAARLCLDHALHPALFVAINGALEPAEAAGSEMVRPLARAILRSNLVPRVISWGSARAFGRAAIDRIGSRLDPAGLALYKRLLAKPGHVAGALSLMSDWNLAALSEALPRLETPVLLIVGERDRLVLPATADAVAGRLPNARIERLADAGHLAHEEQPDRVAGAIVTAAGEVGLMAVSDDA